jgi:transposase
MPSDQHWGADKILDTSHQQEEILKITRSYNKVGKPHCNQVVAVQIVNEDGTVLASDVMDGNTSDIDWNRRVVEYTREIQQALSSTGVLWPTAN